MRLNVMMEEKYVEEVTDKALDWLSKSYTAYINKFNKLCKDYFASIHKLPYLNLAVSIKMYNLCQNNPSTHLVIPGLEEFFK